VYYCNYPRRGFDLDASLAQIEELAEELALLQGRPPVVVAVSFGAGLVLELLRRRAAAGRPLPLAGLALVSPVTCVEDLLDPAAAKATTLLGRVIQPYLAAGGPPAEALVEKSRTVFLRMFEAGAQNKAALRFLLTRAETARLREAVLSGIQAIDAAGATARIQALRDLPAPTTPRSLFSGPALVLYAEKEGAVLRDDAPGWRALRDRTTAWLPQGSCATVRHTAENPVQHASLIFHGHCFAPPLLAFYRRLRTAIAAPRAA
jgi:pimeloyl-ACP methyl ester carboxylesterase